MSKDGNLLWERKFPYTESPLEYGQFNNVQTIDGGYVINGEVRDTVPGNLPLRPASNLWLLKIDSLGCLTPDCHLETSTQEKANELFFKVSPNPFLHQVTLKTSHPHVEKVVVYNSLGQAVYQQNVRGQLSVDIDLSRQAAGVYLLKAYGRQGRAIARQKLIKAH